AHPDTWRPLPSEEATASGDPVLPPAATDTEPEPTTDPGTELEQLALDLDAAPPGPDHAARRQARARWIADREARLAEAARPSVVAATAVAGLLPSSDPTEPDGDPAAPRPRDDHDGEPSDEAEPWRRGRA